MKWLRRAHHELWWWWEGVKPVSRRRWHLTDLSPDDRELLVRQLRADTGLRVAAEGELAALERIAPERAREYVRQLVRLLSRPGASQDSHKLSMEVLKRVAPELWALLHAAVLTANVHPESLQEEVAELEFEERLAEARAERRRHGLD